MKIIKVNLDNRSYLINIGHTNLFKKNGIFFPLRSGQKTMLVTDEKLDKIWKKKLCCELEKLKIKVDQIILPSGEKYKTIQTVNLVISKLLKNSHSRDTVLIALGGGVIGDLTGFAASIYQRGVQLIQIPTTLLSQVDSSIGGKTGVNHFFGKNMIGTFWQPTSVIINIDFLKTLPVNELISGISEVIKYAIIFDNNFFCWLEKHMDSILNMDIDSLFYCIQKCCSFKANIVSLDEKESNLRSLLNLGHTYGHAIETYTGYGNWTHGEAVSAGIVMASNTSNLLGYLNKLDVNRIVSLLNRVGLPTKGPKNMTPSSYLPYMKRDKKVVSDIIKLVLPISIGKAKICTNVNENTILSAIQISNIDF